MADKKGPAARAPGKKPRPANAGRERQATRQARARAETDGRVPQTQKAYEAIKLRILNNVLPPGSQALEQELAAALGMSRTPVREAMMRLASEGLVAVRPRHGMRVLPISVADMAEIYEILTELEATAARAIAARGPTPAEIKGLEDAVAEMDKALCGDDLAAWAAADERFHKLLAAYAGNKRLQAIVDTFFDQTHRARMLTLKLRPRPTRSNDDHRALVAAIRSRDPGAAHRIHHEHRVRNGRMLVELLGRLGLNQL
ncbi:MAG: GntR family transcriptional regulator [Alphaproteobacteria bacterium]|nr:GntR family transcriptional regulator [Alphaproteobacteria bacterium]